MADLDGRLVLEIVIDGIGTEGFARALEEYELDLWELLQEQIRSEVSVGIGVIEADNAWTIAGHSGRIVGARLEPRQVPDSTEEGER